MPDRPLPGHIRLQCGCCCASADQTEIREILLICDARERLDGYLAEYTVTDQNKNSIDVGEKRIGAPTIIKVVEGKPVSKWQLSDAAIFAAGYPKNKYAAWDDATQQGVAASLRDYLAVG